MTEKQIRNFAPKNYKCLKVICDENIKNTIKCRCIAALDIQLNPNANKDKLSISCKLQLLGKYIYIYKYPISPPIHT